MNPTDEQRAAAARLIDEMKAELDPVFSPDRKQWPYIPKEKRKPPRRKPAMNKRYNDDGEEMLAELAEAPDGSFIEMTYDEANNRIYIRHVGRRKQEVVLDREEWAILQDIEIEEPEE